MHKRNLMKNYFVLWIFIFALEATFRLISGMNIWDITMLRILLSSSMIALVLSYVFSWVGKRVSKYFAIASAFLLSIYAFIQLGFNNFIGVYMSINTRSQLGAVTDYIKEFLASFLKIYYLVFIPFLLLVAYYIFLDKYIVRKTSKKFLLKENTFFKNALKTTLVGSILIIEIFLYSKSLTVAFMQDDLQTVSTKDLFYNPSIPSLTVNKFGVLGYGFLDIKSLYIEKEESPDYFVNVEIVPPSDRKIDDTLWESVIKNEKNKKMNDINKYLKNQKIIDYNEYTGIFENKNLIVIMLESVNDIIAYLPEYYPNFAKIYNEGWAFTNHYSPRNSCATGNNEFSGMTGLYTIYNNCTANVYKDNTYYESIFNLFKNRDYKATSMHNYLEHYYSRKTIHKNLGSEKYYGVDDLGIPYYNEYENWSSDEDFMKVAMDITLENKEDPFMLWLTTVSSHQPYVTKSVEGDKYLSLFEDTDYSKDLKRYLSKLKTLDNALGILLDRLEESGILDDTVIVLYGDHYPYGLKKDTINEVLPYNLEDYEVEKTPFVIYNSATESKKIDTYTSYINLLPTIANLFNLEYDPRLYMGTDLFSADYENIVTFADGSWKNDVVYYNAATSKITEYKENAMTIEEIKRINQMITGKMQISSSIIRNNYFEYLENALKKAKEETVIKEDT